MRRIQRDIGKEWCVGLVLLFYPTQSCLKEDVCTESLGLNDGVVGQDYIVKITPVGDSVRRKVSTTSGVGLSDASGSMNKCFTKPAIVRLIGIFIS